MSTHPIPAQMLGVSELRHRLRTPLNHIIGYSEIVLDEHPEGSHRPAIEAVLHQARAMVEVVNQVMGVEFPADPQIAMGQLQTRIGSRIGAVLERLSSLQGSMAGTAGGDLERIAAAARALESALTNGAIAEAGAQLHPSVHPIDTPVEVRTGPPTGAGRILVVDDDEMNRDMLSRQLERQSHQVGAAADGATALKMLSASRFDIVLLDLMMPGMNGFEVLEKIKRDPSLSGVAVILVSALDEMDSVVRSIEAGAEDYLFKPVNPTLLRARIKSTLEKLRTEENLRRKQRLESIGLLAAGIAHDFNNLLTGIIGHAQLLEYSLTDDSAKEAVGAIVTAGERAADLTRQLLAYSGKTMFQMKPVDLVAVIRDTEGLIHASFPRNVTLHLKLGRAPGIVGDQNQIRQVLLNLVLNAAEAFGPDMAGSVTIETGGDQVDDHSGFEVAPDEFRPGRYAWFEVSDTGCGMAAATVAKMFEPFFTTKFLGRGLGLAAVSGIVRAHHGLLRVTTAQGEGTAVRAFFPAAEEAEQLAESGSGPFVMVVDDEPVVTQIVKVALERAGRKVLVAGSGEAAVEAFGKLGSEIELIILDLKMPVVNGTQTLERIRAIRSDVKVIVSSGLGRSEAESQFRKDQVTGYLQKPYRMSELVALVEGTAPRAAV